MLGHGSGRFDNYLLSMTGAVSDWAAPRCCLCLIQVLAEIYSETLKMEFQVLINCRLIVDGTNTGLSKNWYYFCAYRHA